MNSINKKDCSVCAENVSIKIINHKFHIPRFDGERYWEATLYNGSEYFVAHIIEDKSWHSKCYYTGVLFNDKFKEMYACGYVSFGFSNYSGIYRYILEAMVQVINGDYSEIKGFGISMHKPIYHNGTPDM